MRPAASIVIPTHDRPERLAAAIAAVARLEREGEIELIVVDDGGTASLDRALAAGGEAIRPRLVRTGGLGPAAARNAGAAVAEGDLLGFLDDDCAPEPGWLEALMRVAGGRVAAGGRTVNALPENACSAASQLIDDAVHSHFAGTQGRSEFISSSNLLLGRTAFAELGGYDERFPVPGGEDRDLCMRWREAGGELVLVAEARVRHSHELSLPGFLRQHHSYGRGAWLARHARAGRGAGLHARPSLTSGIFADAIRRAGGDPKLIGLVLAWQAATLSGVAREAARRRSRR